MCGVAYGKEEVTNVMSDVYRDSHVREVKSVTQTNKGQSYSVMKYELFEILSRLFQLQYKHNSLLEPVSSLEEVVCFEHAFVRAVWKSFEHSGCVEIPERPPRHNIQAERSEDGKIHGGVYLLHETRLFASVSNPGSNRHGPNNSLHSKFSCETKNDSVERDKSHVVFPLSIHHWSTGVFGSYWVGEEDGWVEGVLLPWVRDIGRQNY